MGWLTVDLFPELEEDDGPYSQIPDPEHADLHHSQQLPTGWQHSTSGADPLFRSSHPPLCCHQRLKTQFHEHADLHHSR